MEDINDIKEKLNAADPYDFDIKYSATSPKSDLNELKANQKPGEAININNSNGNKVSVGEVDKLYK